MTVKLWLEYANFLGLTISVMCLVVLWRKRAMADFKMLTAFVASEVINDVVLIPILFFRKALGIPYSVATHVNFYASWTIFVVQTALLIGIVYGVFHLAMKPLKGLHQMGKLAFRWVGSVAILLSLALGLGPHLSSPGYSLTSAWISAMSHIMQGVSILILCLLLFVCFTIKPLGLTFRSRIFGVSLGLGVYATVQLVAGAWTSVSQTSSVYSPINLLNALGAIVGYSIWLTYFAMPEPERRMILLPTTSPYFFWNAISEALGDDPGHVVVAGFTPSVLAKAELNLLTEQARINASRAEVAEAFEVEPVPASAPRRRRQERQLATAS
jgi:hypothetical protein